MRKGRAPKVREMPEVKAEQSESFTGGQTEVPRRFRISIIMVPSCKVVPSMVVPSSVMEYTGTVTDIWAVAQTTNFQVMYITVFGGKNNTQD